MWLHVKIGDRAQELAEACGGRPLAAHMVGTAIFSGTAQLEEVLQAVASPAVAHLQPLDRFASDLYACSHSVKLDGIRTASTSRALSYICYWVCAMHCIHPESCCIQLNGSSPRGHQCCTPPPTTAQPVLSYIYI